MNDDSILPVVSQLLKARSDAGRAAILLQLADSIVLSAPLDLGEACDVSGFTLGQVFVAKRAALLCRTRDQHGLLPAVEAAELEQLRQALSHLAAGMGGQGG